MRTSRRTSYAHLHRELGRRDAPARRKTIRVSAFRQGLRKADRQEFEIGEFRSILGAFRRGALLLLKRVKGSVFPRSLPGANVHFAKADRLAFLEYGMSE